MGIMNRAYCEGWREVKTPHGVEFRLLYPPKREDRTIVMAKYRAKQRAAASGSGGIDHASDEQFCASYPAIHEFLTDVPDGASPNSAPATITIFAEDGGFKLCLNDRTSGLLCFSWGATIEEAHQALEASLRGGTADWRKPKGGGKKR